jgi:hypothetical protein
MRFPLAAVLICVPCIVATAMAADEPPRRKSGLWRIEQTTKGMPLPMGAIETCVDEKTDDLMRQRLAAREQKCEKMDFRREGDAFRVSSVCKFERTVATTEGKFTGSFDSAYRAELHITYAPPLHDLASADMAMDAKWLGPCKPGQKPGDIVMPGHPLGGPGGKPINVQELMKMRDALKKGAAPSE